MLRSLWNGASGMTAQTMKMDLVANNLANINTTGYKKQVGNFSDLLYQRINTTDKPIRRGNPEQPPALGAGVKLAKVYNLFTQGPITETGRELDVAIQGKGFFEVELPDGQYAYTRDGVFHVDDQGLLVNSSGYRLSASVYIPPETKSLHIAEDGLITAELADGYKEELGYLPLYSVDNPAGLRPIGENLFLPTPESGVIEERIPGQDGMGVFKQGYLEGSNVTLVEEMTQLLTAQRAYELSSRSVQLADEMWGIANNLRR